MNQTKEIFPKGEKADNKYFIGTAWVQMLVTDPEFNCPVYNVTFEPGARNSWHSHPGGQLLLVTDGEGYYQEENKPAQIIKTGDVIEIHPNVKHWHGATANKSMTHIGITTNLSAGDAEWFEPVSDEEYGSL